LCPFLQDPEEELWTRSKCPCPSESQPVETQRTKVPPVSRNLEQGSRGALGGLSLFYWFILLSR
jgi:hypothetical protein